MHLKPISRELRRELYGRRRKRWVDFRLWCQTLPSVCSLIDWLTSLPPGIALARAPGNDAPAPGTDDETAARGGDRGTESALEDSEGSRDRPDVLPNPFTLKPSSDDKVIFSFCFVGELLEVFFLLFPFFKMSLCRFLNKNRFVILHWQCPLLLHKLITMKRPFLCESGADYWDKLLSQYCSDWNRQFLSIVLFLERFSGNLKWLRNFSILMNVLFFILL